MTPPREDPIDVLERWSLFGGRWRVLELSDRHALVQLCACTGEPMDRLRSDDLALIAYLRRTDPTPDRRSS